MCIGGDPPYFSGVELPVTQLQEPSLNSTRNVQARLAALERQTFDESTIAEKVRKECKAPARVRLNFPFEESRYHGLVPVDVAPLPPKKLVPKQLHPNWIKQRAEKNRPHRNDMFLPQPRRETALDAHMQVRPRDVAADLWKQADPVGARYRLYGL